MIIGVLALHGGRIEHILMLERLGVTSMPIYKYNDLESIDGLVIPGGESTTMLNLMHNFDIFKPLKERIRSGLPVLATCAGVILLAKEVSNPPMETLALMDISIKRNAFGRQVDSFETGVDIPLLGNEPFPAIFIRAPLIESAGPGVEVIGRMANGNIVAASQKYMIAVSFHPELGSDARLHRFFTEMVANRRNKGRAEESIETTIPAD
ncbi:MAG TPA: pyridoxal 5'-phosphate synthase glutaminase subunit PdxT [Dehalococcoidia bacterium]|nr:pyridoxal 5'-phosphate synthase glutaminase subunit PdxT [Dehalococcoidia bacterium]